MCALIYGNLQRHTRTTFFVFIELLCNFLACAEPDYVLSLNNSSPSVTESTVNFTAALKHQNGSNVDNKVFKFVWKDNYPGIIPDIENTFGNATSGITQAYLFPGHYRMTVNVFENGTNTQVANGVTNFTLTENLNGELRIAQNLSVKPPEGYFATRKRMSISAVLSDVFSNASIIYKWTISPNQSSVLTSNSSRGITLNHTGLYSISVVVIADVLYYTILGIPIHSNKSTVFTSKVEMLDPVEKLRYHGPQALELISHITPTLSCTGSPPFSIALDVQYPDAKNNSWVSKQNSCNISLTDLFNSTGEYSISVHVQNKVGKQALLIKVQVYTDSPPVAAIVPVACVFIAASVVVAIAAAYRHDRRRRPSNTETADFDFHSYSRQAASFFSKTKAAVYSSLTSLWTSITAQYSYHNEKERAHASSYGSLNPVI